MLLVARLVMSSAAVRSDATTQRRSVGATPWLGSSALVLASQRAESERGHRRSVWPRWHLACGVHAAHSTASGRHRSGVGAVNPHKMCLGLGWALGLVMMTACDNGTGPHG